MIKAEYIDHLGSDLTVVNAARVSFDKESEWLHCNEFKIDGGDLTLKTHSIKDGDKRLISYLARHKHFTPFTHPVIQLRETVPIPIARQRFKSKVGFTENEISRRYVDSEPEFFMPDEWRERAKDKKQGSGGKHPKSEMWTEVISETYRSILKTYNSMICDGVAPEQARMILPQAMMTSYYVTGSLAAFARAYKLRIAEDSQKEIQMLAKQWDEIIRPLYPESWASLNE